MLEGEIIKLLEEGLENNVFTHACVIINDTKVKIGEEHIYDIASLTKPIAGLTASLIVFDELPVDVLEHKAGFPAWELLEGPRDEIIRKAKNMRGKEDKAIYSDIGYIALTGMLEEKAEKRLDEILKNHLGRNTFFGTDEELLNRKDKIVPTSRSSRVHDENAYRMGGISCHAGLFSTADDIADFIDKVMEGAYPYDRIKDDMLKFLRNPNHRFFLSFDTFIRSKKILLGHHGFTGCSFWFDPIERRKAVLLTNRVFPDTPGDRPIETPSFIKRVREKILKLLL